MKSTLLGTTLAAIAAFAWGFIFWAGGVAEIGAGHLAPAAEEALRAAITENVPASGVYMLPDMANGETEAFASRHRIGPIAQLFVVRAGAEPMAPMVFVLGFLHMWITALVLAFLLRGALPVLQTYGARVYAAAGIGVCVALWGQLGDPIWFYHPWGYHLVAAAYDVVAFALMGAVLGRFVSPKG